MHIGILVTNTDDTDFAKAHPRDGEKFRALLQPLRPDWTFTAVQVKDGEFPKCTDSFDGYIITGSPASANGDSAWIAELLNFIRAIDDAKVPTVGVCFGHQVIARALGGTVSKNPGGWGFGVAETMFNQLENWMEPKQKSLLLYAAHNEQVTQLPSRAIVMGGSNHCPIGSYRIGEHIFTTEYHPEMTKEFMSGLIENYADYLGHEVAMRAREQVKQNVDGKLYAEWMLRFLEMPRSR
jgi:GMP synthase-like glutamine amidotransferase